MANPLQMPDAYGPSLSTGIYGSYTANYPIRIRYNDDYKYSQEEKENIIEKAKQRAIQETQRFVQYAKEHGTPNVKFEKMSIPQLITAKPCKSQVAIISSMYKTLLFQNAKPAPKLGGWTLLGVKNYKRCRNSKMLSPKELGFDIIEPRFPGDPVYANNIIRHMRDGTISLKTAVGRSGSFYVEIFVDNNSDKAITIEFQYGQVFEQDSVRKVQNLAIKGWYKYCKDDDDGRTITYDGNLTPKALSATIPAKAKDYKLQIECLCIDHKHSGPQGESVNATPFKSDVGINYEDSDAQRKMWDHLDQQEANEMN